MDIADITHLINDEPLEKPEPRPRGDRTAESELEQRIRMVIKWISRGMPYSEVVAFCCGTFGVCERTAQSYAAEANKRIRESNGKDREKDVAVAKQRYETFMQHAFEAKDYSVAVSANNALVKLLGLAEPDKVEHNAGDALLQLLDEIRGGTGKPSV